mgnify:CR=1 FL=1
MTPKLHFWVVLLLLLIPFWGFAQQADSSACRLRISILTCGPGGELYSVYGHSAIRVIDSCHGYDVVYNYGTFNFSDPDFYWKFTRGKLDYYLNEESFDGFFRSYSREGRSVYEQVLSLSTEDAYRVYTFLKHNLVEENKYYRYDFLFDNCSTRIRDIFLNLFGRRFQYGYVIRDDSMSFRTVLNHYERNLHWERLGINLLMSDQVDKKMNNNESMFLPDYLQRGFHAAKLDAKPLIAQTLQLLPQQFYESKTSNTPKRVFWALLLIVLLVSIMPNAKKYLIYFDVLFFLLIGLLGCFMLFMWLATEHAVCANNLHLLWALPLHVLFAFILPRQNDMVYNYARYASLILLWACVLQLFVNQKYMSELTPLLILLFIRLSSHSKRIRMLNFKTQFARVGNAN